MNDRKLPCVNTILLNRYMKEQERDDAYYASIDDARTDAQDAPITADDLYEFGCWLEMAGAREDAMRARLAKLLDALKDAKYTREAMAELVGYAVLGLVQENRADRAQARIEGEA